MRDQRAYWSRREFVGGLTLAGTAGLLEMGPGQAAAEPPPETTRLRLAQTPSLCQAPQYIADALLHSEGFNDVQYVKVASVHEAFGPGRADISMAFVGPLIIRIEAGDPITVLAGGHVGCLELVATDRVRSIRDLKGRTLAIRSYGSTEHVFLASTLRYVGLDPARDARWSLHLAAEWPRLFEAGKIDAFMAFPPSAQELRARKVGQVLVNFALDRPWSQYFCCVLAGNRDFAREHPVATKRALRAILKSADFCATEPESAARSLVDKGFTPRFDYALQAIQELPYGKWREYDPEDTVRFYALRLHEAGMIKSSPQKIIAQGTDWRSLNELKKELKG